MPDLVAHYYLGHRVFDTLPPEMQQKINRPLYDFTTAGPDAWFSIGFPVKKRRKLLVRGKVMHTQKTGEFLQCLAEQAKKRPASRDDLFSYLAGFLCHYWLDSFCHPYIMTKTGEYDPADASTLRYRGQHIRFERAIDSHFIRTYFHAVPWRFSPFRRILTLRTLPESLRDGLNEAHEAVYGFENAYDDLCCSVTDERHFFFCAFDRFGILYRLLDRLDKGVSAMDLKQYSYWHKDIDPAVFDVMNESHSPWHHFRDTSLVSTESFMELFEKACEHCSSSLEACYAYVYGDAPYPADIIGRRSYETGFDWDDPRHQNAPVFEDCFANLKK